MNANEAQLRSRVDAFVTELSALVRQAALAAVAEALGTGGAAPPKGPPRAGGRPARMPVATGRAKPAPFAAHRKGAKRPAEEITKTTARLFDYIKAHPAQRIEQIGKAIGVTTKDLALPTQKLLAEKKIASKGQRRATTYTPK